MNPMADFQDIIGRTHQKEEAAVDIHNRFDFRRVKL